MKKRVIILGSTGSVGTQALDVIRHERDQFEVVGLSANENEKLLKEQAEEFEVAHTVLAHGESKPLAELVTNVEADLVLVAVMGVAGLEPTLAAIQSGKNIAIANKETLVIDGAHVMEEAQKHNVQLIPVDSEHSAIFQCLQNINKEDVDKIILTCSGGPFWPKTRANLENVTPEQALNHPTWKMSPKITIDSATLINKGLEVIEAHHLFGFDYDQIEVRVHPQSLVHGIVQLKDGNTLMHASGADMRIPIRYALYYPNRAPLSPNSQITSLNLFNQKLDFFDPAHEALEGIKLGYQAGRTGPKASTAFVQANEQAVQDFLNGEIKFLEIYEYIKAALE